MKFFPLIWSAFKRRKTRTLFTFLSVIIAFTLFSVLAPVHQGLVGQVGIASAQRLVTISKRGTGRGTGLPLHYKNAIAATPGVAAMSYFTGFAGYYREPKNHFVVLGSDPAATLKLYPEFKLPPAQKKALLADQQGALAGPALAARMGWKIGDRIPVQGGIPRKDESKTWYFNLDGIYHTKLPAGFKSYFLVHYKYINQARAHGKDTLGQIQERVSERNQVSAVAASIDRRFAGSSPQTVTQPQQAYVQSFVRQFGNITVIIVAIGAAVFFSLLLIVTNSMAQSVRERTAEFAVLKALGFTRARLVLLILSEALVLTCAAALCGLALGYEFTALLAPTVTQVLQTFALTGAAAGVGLGMGVLFGVAATIVPGSRVVRLEIAEALRRR
jgi:putative ABC transport system permease protein